MALRGVEARLARVWFVALGSAVAGCGGSTHAGVQDSGTDASLADGASSADGAAMPENGDATPTPDDAGTPDGALLVDDESSSIGRISLANGSSWYTYPLPGEGTIAPTPGTTFFFTPTTGPGFSSAACISATGITGFGAGMGFGFQLPTTDGTQVPFDASRFSGLSFYAMSPDAPDVVVTFSDIGTYSYAPGATCAGGADAGPFPDGGYPVPPCGDSPQAAVALSSAWQKVTLSFAKVSAFPISGYYSPTSVDPSGLFYLTFGLSNPNARIDGGAPLAFHICVAQIYLLP
jgi:hypothetical protein